MRKHNVQCRVDSSIPTEFIQKKINIYTILHIKKELDESYLSKEDKLKITNEMIEYIKNNTQ